MKTEIERFLDKEEMRLDDASRQLDKLENYCAGDCYNCAQRQAMGEDCVFNKERIQRNRMFIMNRKTFVEDFRAAFVKDQKSEVTK